MNTYETFHEKTYVAGKEHIKSSIIKTLTLVIGFDLFTYIVTRELEPIMVVLSLIILFPIILCSFAAINNYKVFINQEHIGFQALYNPKEPTIYKWEDVNMVVIGDVEVKYSRFPHYIFGVQIFYSEKIRSTSYATFNTYPLRHINEYEELIKDIQIICSKYDIKYLEQRENEDRKNLS